MPPLADQAVLFPRRLASMQQHARRAPRGQHVPPGDLIGYVTAPRPHPRRSLTRLWFVAVYWVPEGPTEAIIVGRLSAPLRSRPSLVLAQHELLAHAPLV